MITSVRIKLVIDKVTLFIRRDMFSGTASANNPYQQMNYIANGNQQINRKYAGR